MIRYGIFVIISMSLYVVFVPCIRSEKVHQIVKRALSERNLTDPDACVQKCFIKQNRAVAEDSNSTNTNGSNVVIPNKTVHPAVRGCDIHNVAAECLKNCPPSPAKNLYLDSILTETAQCNVSNDLLIAQWNCVSNESLISEIKACNSKCPSIPLGLTESIGLNPNAVQVVFINYESDKNIIEKDLKESCSSAICLWPCMQPIVEAKCGKAVADQSNVINKAEIQSVANTFIDLKVIDKMPDECKKYLS